MERNRLRAHERRKEEATRQRHTRRKGRKTSRSEGSVMQAEVRRYKEAEKALLEEGRSEGRSVTNQRVTMQRKIYIRSQCPGNVARENINMTAETEAKAKANLSDIIAGAGESLSLAPPPTQPPKTVSPKRYFLPMKRGSRWLLEEREGTLTLVQSNNSSLDSSSSPHTPTPADSSDKFKQRSSDIPTERPRDHSLLKPAREKTKPPQPPPPPPPPGSSLSSLRLGLVPSEASGKAEGKVTKPAVKQPRLYEYLMAAVIEGQDKVLRRKLPRASGMSAELLRKIKQKYDKGERERQRQRERETKTANTDSQRSGSTRVIIVHKYTGPLRRPDVLKTPPSQDSRCDKTTGVTSKVVCPGTTIISPQGLLQRHENLQRNVERHWHPQEPQQEPMESSQGQEGMDWVFDDDSKMSESQRTPLPACLPSVSQCPKSVVINPLKYLEYFADSPWDTDKGSCSRDTHQRGAHPRDTHLQATHPLETHMQATHSRDTNLQATHPLETHLRATHPLETHLQATHSRDTNLQATHPIETHLQVTHSRETHLSETHLQATHPSATHQQDTDPMATQTHTSHTSQTQAATATHRPTYIQGVSYGPLVTAGTARTEMYGRDERHPAPYQHTWQGAGGGRGQQVYDTGWQGESYVPHYYQHLSQALPSDTKLNPWHQNPVTHPRPLLDLSDPIFPRYVFQPPLPTLPPPPPPPVDIFLQHSWETLQGSVPRCNTSQSAPLPERHLYYGPGCERARDQLGVGMGVCAGGGASGGGGYVGMMCSQPKQ